MSTSFGPNPKQKIRAAELFDGRLEALGVREATGEGTTDEKKCLTDGTNYLWVYVDDEGQVSCLARYAGNGSPHKILQAIEETFEIEIFFGARGAILGL